MAGTRTEKTVSGGSHAVPVARSTTRRMAPHARGRHVAMRPRIMLFGGTSVMSRILLQELHRAGCGAVGGMSFGAVQQASALNHIDLAIILIDIPPSWQVDLIRWFKANQPGIKLLLVWEGHWEGRDSLRELSGFPQLIMPFTTEQLVAKVLQLSECNPAKGATPFSPTSITRTPRITVD